MNKPFFLEPSYKDYLWGGSRLKEEYNKITETTPLAESWEASVHPDGLSLVSSGEHKGKTLKSVLLEHPEYLGKRLSKEKELPILVKLIDAKEDLSVQVHPSDEYAAVNENGQRGKTEMWYVLEASKEASIVFGFSNDCSQKLIEKALADKTIKNYLRKVKVEKGDVFFVEPGTVHAIQKGCVIAEIQESSNLTYRLYDYDRIDSKGQKRALHVTKALEVLDYECSERPVQPLRVLKYQKGSASEFLARCKYFEVYRMLTNSENENGVLVTADDLSPRILLCTEGKGKITFEGEEMLFKKGQCIFIPANSSTTQILGKSEFLDIRA